MEEEGSVNWKDRRSICFEKKSKGLIREVAIENNITSLYDSIKVTQKLRWICKKEDRDEFTKQKLLEVVWTISRSVNNTEEQILHRFPYEDILFLYQKYDKN